MKLRAVTYIRVSTDEQTRNLSLPTQRERCREFADRNDFEVACEFEDAGESAKTADRPGLKRLLEYCRVNKGRVHAVVVYGLSRFSRNTADHHSIRAILTKSGVTLRSVTEAVDDSPSGKLLENVIASVAQFDNDIKSERTKVGMQAALKMGRWVWRAPLGYVNASRPQRSLLPDSQAARFVVEAFERVASGEEPASVRRDLNTQGFRTRQGAPVSPQTFSSMLRRPVYVGRIVEWGFDQTGDFEALVSMEIFRRVQHRLERTSGRHYHPDSADFILRRFVRCATCRRPLTGSWSVGKSGTRCAYYRCPAVHGRGREATCVNVRREELEDRFVTIMEGLKPAPRFVAVFKDVVLQVWHEQRRSLAAKREERERSVATLRSRLESVEQAFLFEKSIDSQTYVAQRDELREHLAVADLALHETQIDELDVEGLVNFAGYALEQAARLWLEASPRQKRSLQQALFPEGLEFDGTGFRTPLTGSAFKLLGLTEPSLVSMASPQGFEPWFQP